MRRVLISGASGLIGRALTAALSAPTAANAFAPEVHALVRRPARAGAREVFWDAAARIDVDACEGFDAVVHLAGENVGSGGGGPLGFTGRWDARKKHDILASRTAGTALLARTLAALRSPPRVLVCASGVGFYGDGGDAVLSEAAPRGAGFLADVSAAWEAAAQPAADAGVRVVHLRFGVVLSKEGGMIGTATEASAGALRAPRHQHPPTLPPPAPAAKLLLPFSLGLGGPSGPGTQWLSWITLADAVRAIQHVATTDELRGPVNTCAPAPARSADFAAAFGAALHRPAFVPLPSLAVRAVFGEMGDEMLLAGQRAVPAKLEASGFVFAHRDIAAGCREAVVR
jgi:NAD dependent epimerase/dehydratase family enzyme